MNRQKSEPLLNYISRLSPVNQNSCHKDLIVFSAYRVGMALHYASYHAVSNDDFIYSVKCILDCLPVPVSTETVYSNDQFANSYSNPYKKHDINYISVLLALLFKLIYDIQAIRFS